jgi:hypothetical protein
VSVASKQLGLGGPIPTTGATIYTVPAGKRTIVKSIQLQNNHTAAQRIIFSVWVAGVNTFAWGVTPGAAASATESMLLTPWLVLEAGQVLKVQPISGTCQLLVSGAELTL